VEGWAGKKIARKNRYTVEEKGKEEGSDLSRTKIILAKKKRRGKYRGDFRGEGGKGNGGASRKLETAHGSNDL